MKARKLIELMLCGACTGRANICNPCGNCGGDGLSDVGRHLAPFAARMAEAMRDAPVTESLKTHHADAQLQMLAESEALCAAVEAFCDASDMRDAPLDHPLTLVREQAAALAVQVLILVGVCESMAKGEAPQ